MGSLYLPNNPQVGSLDFGMWPDRKRPLLTISHGNTSEVVGYFRDEAACRKFEDWLDAFLAELPVRIETIQTKA